MKKAYNKNYETIIIEGELAKKIYNSRKLFKSKAALASLAIIGTSIFFTKGLTALAVVPLAAITGTEVVAIIAVCVIGIGFLIALFKDYEEIEMSATHIKLRRKSDL